MNGLKQGPPNPGERSEAGAPVALMETELRAVAGGLNPQPLPPRQVRDYSDPNPSPW
jgi:hypothetical protein